MKDASPLPVCDMCKRPRTVNDNDYSPLQVVTGQTVGWYSSVDGEICPQCMTRTLNQ